jgi:hypothetical protein
MSSAEPTVTRIDDVQVVGERINALIDASASGGVVARERAESSSALSRISTAQGWSGCSLSCTSSVAWMTRRLPR